MNWPRDTSYRDGLDTYVVCDKAVCTLIRVRAEISNISRIPGLMRCYHIEIHLRHKAPRIARRTATAGRKVDIIFFGSPISKHSRCSKHASHTCFLLDFSKIHWGYPAGVRTYSTIAMRPFSHAELSSEMVEIILTLSECDLSAAHTSAVGQFAIFLVPFSSVLRLQGSCCPSEKPTSRET